MEDGSGHLEVVTAKDLLGVIGKITVDAEEDVITDVLNTVF